MLREDTKFINGRPWFWTLSGRYGARVGGENLGQGISRVSISVGLIDSGCCSMDKVESLAF